MLIHWYQLCCWHLPAIVKFIKSAVRFLQGHLPKHRNPKAETNSMFIKKHLVTFFGLSSLGLEVWLLISWHILSYVLLSFPHSPWWRWRCWKPKPNLFGQVQLGGWGRSRSRSSIDFTQSNGQKIDAVWHSWHSPLHRTPRPGSRVVTLPQFVFTATFETKEPTYVRQLNFFILNIFG